MKGHLNLKIESAVLAVLLSVLAAHAIDAVFYAKENSGNAVSNYPVTLAIPLPAGQFTDITSLRVTDASGAAVPAQISVLNRHWRLNYIRHVLVSFCASLAANEKKAFHLRNDGGNIAPGNALSVTETANDITVVTGPLKFKVKKQNFNLFDEAWLDLNNNGSFDAGEQLIAPSADNGGVFTGRLDNVQKSSDVTSPVVTLEEVGPVRAIIKIEAPTIYNSTTDHVHGYMARIYAYAGKSIVKVEYTLKNSAKNKKWAWPLYCKDFSVRTAVNIASPTVTIGSETDVQSQALGNGLYVFQKTDAAYDIKTSSGVSVATGAKAPGWLDLSDANKGVTVYVRNFWEMWPSGLEADPSGAIYVRMLPKWEGGYYWSGGISRTPFAKSAANLHWLDDMQHLTKEILYEFHAGAVNATAAAAQSKVFARYPVGIVSTGWYAQTRVTADLGGYLPFATPAAATQSEVNYYPDGMGSIFYCFGWPNFMGNPYESSNNTRIDRHSACEPGDVPPSALRMMGTENPASYFQDQALVWGELNVRPEWMGGDLDFHKDSALALFPGEYSPSPYCNYSLRADPNGVSGMTGEQQTFRIDAPYLANTSHHGWTARDEQHTWWYQPAEFYFYDGMPIVKDWYKFVGEFEKYRVYIGYYYDKELGVGNTRSYGQNLSAMVSAWKITGDPELGKISDIYVQRLKQRQNKACGTYSSPEESALMMGFMGRALTHYMDEMPSRSCREYQTAFSLLEGICEWNYNYCRWCYTDTINVRNTTGGMSGTGLPLADPTAWFYLFSGRSKYKNHVKTFADAKIYGDLLKWNLTFDNYPVWVGRLTQYIFENPKADTMPPAQTTDLSGQAAQPSGGTKLWVMADSLPTGKTLYFALRSFDTANNMSVMSNVYSANPGASRYYLTWTPTAGSQYYHLMWSDKPLVERDSADTAHVTMFWAGNPIGNGINAPTALKNGAVNLAKARLVTISLRQQGHGRATVTIAGARGSVDILDFLGRRVAGPLITSGETIRWKTDGVAPGLYFVCARAADQVFRKPVFIAR